MGLLGLESNAARGAAQLTYVCAYTRASNPTVPRLGSTLVGPQMKGSVCWHSKASLLCKDGTLSIWRSVYHVAGLMARHDTWSTDN